MGAPITITKEQMAEGFAKGRALIQEEWAHPQEIKWVDELIVEGKATATPWEYKGNFQCERRRVTGNAAIRALAQPAVGRDGR